MKAFKKAHAQGISKLSSFFSLKRLWICHKSQIQLKPQPTVSLKLYRTSKALNESARLCLSPWQPTTLHRYIPVTSSCNRKEIFTLDDF